VKKLSIIIPVFNEAQTCAELFRRVSEKSILGFDKEVIVVESRSTDGSRELVQDFAKSPFVKAIFQDEPRGKGFAVREGLRAATGDIILIQNADLEYDINDYDKLLAPIVEGKTQFVLGSRHLGKQSWQIRAFESYPGTAMIMNFAHWAFTFIFNVLYRQKTTDPATMYKVFSRSCLEGIEFRCNRFVFDFELVSKLVLAGYSPIEIPVEYMSRGFAEGKKVQFFRDPLTWVKVLFMTRLIHDKNRLMRFLFPSAQKKSVIQNDQKLGL
jgi:glycosyltransferase involved in cell wall biosynthesis